MAVRFRSRAWWGVVSGVLAVLLLAPRLACIGEDSQRIMTQELLEGSIYRKEIQRLYPFKEVEYANVDRDLQLVSGPPTYEPIRIRFDTELIEERRSESEVMDEEITTIIDEILPAAAETWTQHLSVRPIRSAFTVQPFDCGDTFLGRIGEKTFTDADLVVIVSADENGPCETPSTLAYAFVCKLDTSLNRPVVGSMNFCLNNDVAGSTTAQLPVIFDVDIVEYYGPWTQATYRGEHLRAGLLETAVHELAHVLGQTSFLFSFFQDENGEPRTRRDSRGWPVFVNRQCGNGTAITDLLPSESTIKVVGSTDGRFQHFVVTPRVQSIARNHFNCGTLVGGRLDDGDGGCIGTHWHERHWHGSLLGPALSGISENTLSPITLALMEDSGWYQVDYRNSTPPAFGLGAGCEFVNDECINSTSDKVPDWVESEFCDAPFILGNEAVAPESLNNVFCDPAYFSFAICDLSDLLAPSERTYFSNPLLSPMFFDIADSCPMPILGLGLDCRIEAPYNAFYLGESVGENSRCLNAFYENDVGTANRPACMQVTCDTEAGVVRIGQGEYEQVCTKDGELLPSATGDSDAFIICPRLAAVCPELFTCPESCFGRGDCVIPDDDNLAPSGTNKPFCRCYDESNTDPSCVPPTATREGRPTSSPVPALDNTGVPVAGIQPSASPSLPVAPQTSCSAIGGLNWPSIAWVLCGVAVLIS